MMSRNDVNFIDWISTDKQLSDNLTKYGASVKTSIDVIENGYFSKIF